MQLLCKYRKNDDNNFKTPKLQQTPVQRRPHVATDEVRNQHETTVSQKLEYTT